MIGNRKQGTDQNFQAPKEELSSPTLSVTELKT